MSIEKYYENYMDLFQQEGWKQLKEDLKDTADSIHILSLNDSRDLHLAQGQLNVLHRLLSWEEAIGNSYDEFLRDGLNDETSV